MATVTAGSTATVNLTAGQTLVVSTAGEAVVAIVAGVTGAGYESRRVVATAAEFGPFDADAVMTVRAVASGATYVAQAVSGVNGLVIVSEEDPVDNDGRPDGTIWQRPGFPAAVKAGGTYSVTADKKAEFRREYQIRDEPVYQNDADRDRVIAIGGAVTSKFRNRIAVQDLMQGVDSLTNPLTGHTNAEIVNIGQALVPVPGATSAPYWTDPGPVTLTRGNSDACGIPGNIPGAIEFMTDPDGTKFVRFTSAEGFGNAANGKRRSQLFFDWVSGRIHAAWDLSFRIAPTDDAPYSSSPLYKYPFLLFQHKGAGEPMFGLNVEGLSDGTYNLYWVHKYSSQTPDTVTFRRAWNSTSPANIQAQSGVQRFFERVIRKGEWIDMRIEVYFDERDITDEAGGDGYLNIWINGEQVLAYVGPTLSIRDVGGATPSPHSWMVGVYRHETGAPTELKELDLNRQESPAPFTRAVDFREPTKLVTRWGR